MSLTRTKTETIRRVNDSRLPNPNYLISALDHHYCQIVSAWMGAAETASVFKTRCRQSLWRKRDAVAHQP
jgi:hypothetical protein